MTGRPKTYVNWVGTKIRRSRSTRAYQKNQRSKRVTPFKVLSEDECESIVETASASGIRISRKNSDLDLSLSSIEEVYDIPMIRPPSSFTKPSGSTSSSSSESTDDSSCTNDSMNDALLYSNAQLTKAESLHLILGYRMRYSLTEKATDDLLKLIRHHLPLKTLVPFPTSTYTFDKSLDLNTKIATYYYYCASCEIVLPQSLKCEQCANLYTIPTLRTNGHFFILYDIRSQLELLLKDTRIVAELESTFRFRDTSTQFDIINEYGRMYPQYPKGSHGISLTLNSDGAQIFSSSSKSAWPVLCSVTELGATIRKKNVILCALWIGQQINVHLVFSELVPFLNDLYENPIGWKSSTGNIVHSNFSVIKIVADAKARCILQGLMMFNSKHGCNWCVQETKSVRKGRGNASIYPYNAYVKTKLRTDEDHRNRIMNDDYSFGIKTATPLLLLKNFDIIRGFAIDSLHQMFIGVVKCFFSIWYYRKDFKNCSIKESEATIDNILKTVKVPSEIVRTAKSLGQFKFYKASEFRTWAFLIPIVLKDILPTAHLHHFSLLSNCIFLLSKPSLVQTEKDYCEKALLKFVKKIEELYGIEYMTYNVHLLLHLVQTCDDFGPLHQSSAFIFESFNARIVKYVKSSNLVAAQVSKHYSRDIQLRMCARTQFTRNKSARDYFYSLLNLHPKFSESFFVKKPLRQVVNMNSAIRQEIMRHSNATTFYSGKSACIQNSLFKCKETSKRADCYVVLSSTTIGQVESFYTIDCNCIFDCACEKSFAVIQKFKVSTVPHLTYAFCCSVDVPKERVVLPLCHLNNTKFFKLIVGSTVYFLVLCNLFEID